jgi:hypothetical protein
LRGDGESVNNVGFNEMKDSRSEDEKAQIMKEEELG